MRLSKLMGAAFVAASLLAAPAAQAIPPKYVTVGQNPWGVAIDAMRNRVYVTNYTSGTLSELTLSGTLLRNVPLGLNSEPEGVAVDPTTGYVYVADFGTGSISYLPPGKETPTTISGVGIDPNAIAVDPARDLVYVSSYLSSTVSEYQGATHINPPAHTPSKTFSLPGANIHDLVYDAKLNLVYASAYNLNEIATINPVTGSVKVQKTGFGPDGLALDPEDKTLYAAINFKQYATDWYPAVGALPLAPLFSHPLTQAPSWLASPQTNHLFATVPTANEVEEFYGRSLVNTFKVGPYPRELAAWRHLVVVTENGDYRNVPGSDKVTFITW